MDRRRFLLGAVCFCGSFTGAFARGGGDDEFARPSRRGFDEPEAGEILRCGTASPSPRDQARAASAVSSFYQANREFPESIAIPVHYHVIHDGEAGKIPENRILAQHDALSEAFEACNITFPRRGVFYIDKPEWYALQATGEVEREAKAALGRDIGAALNIYFANIYYEKQGDLLGRATFPWDLAIDPALDGILLHNTTPPGGGYFRGKTAIHETGHWLGLFHTFQNGCDDPGDSVDDTPFEEKPGFRCPVGRKSCPDRPGDDPVHNYMDYSGEQCMTEFTPLQIAHMRALTAIFRTRLLSDGARASLVLDVE